MQTVNSEITIVFRNMMLIYKLSECCLIGLWSMLGGKETLRQKKWLSEIEFSKVYSPQHSRYTGNISKSHGDAQANIMR